MKVLTLLFFLTLALAQNSLQPRESLCVMTQGVFSQTLAEAIRHAVAERGVQVYVLVPPALVQTPASYLPALSLLDGVHIRLIDHQENFVIQDATVVFVDEQPRNTNTAALYSYFLEQWEYGMNYTFAVVRGSN